MVGLPSLVCLFFCFCFTLLSYSYITLLPSPLFLHTLWIPSISTLKMEVALMQAKKSCPFIHVTSTNALKRLSANASAGNGLLRKAQQCPVMSQAMGQQARPLSTSSVAKQTPSKVAQAEGKHIQSKKRIMGSLVMKISLGSVRKNT